MVSAVFRQEHCDALNGLFKVGMSKAASSLTELINNEVALTISSLTAVGFDLGLASLNQISIRNFNAVGQSFNGEFVGSAFLFFNNESSLDLIHSILEKEGWTKELGEMEQEALKEISNIIETQYERAIKLLKKHKKKLIELADFLLDKEVIFKEDLVRIYGERPFDLKDLSKK